MTLPVYNLLAPFVDKQGRLSSPWNMFIQQLVQAAPDVAHVPSAGSPFSFTANAKGNLIVTGGTISSLILQRGQTTINLTGQRIIPISINDTVIINYSSQPTLQFLGS